MKTTNLFKPLCFLCLCWIISFSSINLFAQEKKTEITSTYEFTINSTSLNEERVLSICLPDNYENSEQKYPVLYLLDGRTHFNHAIGATSFLTRQGIIPQMIIVSIQNVDRNRDFSPVHVDRIPTSGGASSFLNFLSDELIPYVNRNYRSSDFNILLGHSFGGTFSVYSLLTKPELFDAYIAISPYLQYAENHMVNEAKTLLGPDYPGKKFFFMTIGNEPPYFPALKEFSSVINEQASESFDFSYVKLEDEDHNSIPYISLFKGLRYIFSDWQLSQELFNKGLEAIDKHYRSISEKYGFEVKTPENTINLIGYTYLRAGEIAKAIEIFKENVKRFPGSANVYDSLGEAYENNNQLDLAEENYRKAFEIAKKENHQFTEIYKANMERVSKK